MVKPMTEKAKLKKAVKEALCELLTEDQNLLHEIVADAVEDWMLGKLIEKERGSRRVPRRKIFEILEGRE